MFDSFKDETELDAVSHQMDYQLGDADLGGDIVDLPSFNGSGADANLMGDIGEQLGRFSAGGSVNSGGSFTASGSQTNTSPFKASSSDITKLYQLLIKGM